MTILAVATLTHAADSGVNEELLLFKAGLVDSYQSSQWNLLYENDFLDRPEMMAAAFAGIESYLIEVVKTRDEELFFVFDEELTVRFATEPVPYSVDELVRFRSAIVVQPLEMVLLDSTDLPALVGFYSEEFELYFALLFRRMW